MTKLLLATGNKHKAEEICAIIARPDIKILTLRDFPNYIPPEETGKTLKENAFIKAKQAGDKTGLPALSDDTGLEVGFLNGAPGVMSARYAGGHCSYSDNNKKLLKELGSAKNRSARFVCVCALYNPADSKCIFEEGVLEGEIIHSPAGGGGFGYDCLFKPKGYETTLAQMPAEQKNKISHRYTAVCKISKYIG